MRAFKPPHREGFAGTGERLFLAGSIDQGAARDWQADICHRLEDLDVSVYNPRRDEWHPDWEQSIHNADFREQVEWELDHLDAAHVIALVFDEKGKAPISLLELGLYAASGKILCFCPTDYWRAGNVQITCDRYGIPLFERDFEGFVEHLRTRIQDKALAMSGAGRVAV